MRPLSAAELLAVWEKGLAAPAAERALLLLAAAYPDEAPQDLAQLSVGQRDGRLLALRATQFGEQLDCMVPCPGCGEQLELSFDIASIRTAPPPKQRRTIRLRRKGYDVRFRLPNSLDLLALEPGDEAQMTLLQRCLRSANLQGESISPGDLPDTIIRAIVARMAQADPQAEIQVALSCPACEHEWLSLFDIVSYLWSEINTWAMRLLQDIHQLAMAYGWREADILALSPWRRRIYLQMSSAL
ncbi:MAG TPA: phage baseplate protein [Candidatus Binatia bacterium]|nr:phage baseplate protein [Candidatus Binatia bacterium]